jgi:hypothetical protein
MPHRRTACALAWCWPTPAMAVRQSFLLPLPSEVLDRKWVCSLGVVYAADVKPDMPANPPIRRPAKYAKPSAPSVLVVQMIDTFHLKALRRYSWRRSTKGILRQHFAAVRRRVAEGDLISLGQPLPGQAPHGWGAKRAPAACTNTSPIIHLTRRAGHWSAESKRVGDASGRISNPRTNLSWSFTKPYLA